MPHEWDDGVLIEVQKRPILYDNTHPDARNTTERNIAWKDITQIVTGSESPTAVERVKQRWKSMRDSYVKALRARINCKKTGTYYKYEQQLQFLEPYLKLTQEGERSQHQIVNFDDFYDEEGGFAMPVESIYELDSDEQEDSMATVKLDETPQNSNESTTGEGPVFYYNIHDGTGDIDEFFGNLAKTVKMLKPRSIAKLKKKIADLVMDAEIEELEQSVNE